MAFTLETQEYEALIALARKGAKTQEEIIILDTFLRAIEKKNGIVRHLLWVQWQEQDQPLPPTARFPTTWPPEMRQLIEYLSRPVAKTDVDAVVAKFASKPMNILVTKDPAALLGWTPVAQFFRT